MKVAPHTHWRPWLLLTAALWMSFAPAVIAAMPAGFTHAQGASALGSDSAPSACKYLYANADPLQFSDPTGRFGDVSLPALGEAIAIIGTLTVIAIPQVYQSGVRAATTLIQAGEYGAGRAIENTTTILLSLTLTLEIAKAKATTAEESKRQGSAVIGENMLRVTLAAEELGAETFAPVSFLGGSLPETMVSQSDFDYWMWADRAWIRSVMARRMWIYDIGRDETRYLQGRRQSEFYAMELEETTLYPLKSEYSFPGSGK